MFAAADRGHERLVQLFLEKGAKVHLGGGPGLDGPFGQTPLHVAARSPEIVRRLLAAGADPTRNDAAGWTPLDYAYSTNNEETVALFEVDLCKRSGEGPQATRENWEFKNYLQDRHRQLAEQAKAIHEGRAAALQGEQERLQQEWETKVAEDEAARAKQNPPTLAPKEAQPM